MRRTPRSRDQRGTALIELAFVLPILLLLLLGTIDFGHLIQTRLVMTNVAREGASLASRQAPVDPNITNLLVASGRPLRLDGADGRVYVTRIKAGLTEQDPQPTITDQITAGGLGVSSRIADAALRLGLTQPVFDHLVFDADNGTADISEVTIVEIYYRYRPITPFPNFAGGLLRGSGNGMIISSRAVF
jgi:hypothetical protein